MILGAKGLTVLAQRAVVYGHTAAEPGLHIRAQAGEVDYCRKGAGLGLVDVLVVVVEHGRRTLALLVVLGTQLERQSFWHALGSLEMSTSSVTSIRLHTRLKLLLFFFFRFVSCLSSCLFSVGTTGPIHVHFFGWSKGTMVERSLNIFIKMTSVVVSCIVSFSFLFRAKFAHRPVYLAHVVRSYTVCCLL